MRQRLTAAGGRRHSMTGGHAPWTPEARVTGREGRGGRDPGEPRRHVLRYRGRLPVGDRAAGQARLWGVPYHPWPKKPARPSRGPARARSPAVHWQEGVAAYGMPVRRASQDRRFRGACRPRSPPITTKEDDYHEIRGNQEYSGSRSLDILHCDAGPEVYHHRASPPVLAPPLDAPVLPRAVAGGGTVPQAQGPPARQPFQQPGQHRRAGHHGQHEAGGQRQ